MPIKIGDRVMVNLTERLDDPKISERQRVISSQWHGVIGIVALINEYEGMARLNLETPVWKWNKDTAQFLLSNLVRICEVE